jgi:hypothetical protein
VLVVSGNQVVRTGATLDIALGALRIRVLEIAFAAQLTALSSATFANASIDPGLTEYARVVDLALVDDVCLCRRAALGRLDAPCSIVVSRSFEGLQWRFYLLRVRQRVLSLLKSWQLHLSLQNCVLPQASTHFNQGAWQLALQKSARSVTIESTPTLDTSEVSLASPFWSSSRVVGESRLAVAPASASRLAAARKMALSRMLGVEVDRSVLERC